VRSPATSTEVGLGVLVLADISGFTEFVTATELEHGPPIIAELLGEVMRQISPPLEIQEVEGDAVFAVATDRVLGPPATLLDVLEDAVAAFRNRQRELQADDSCSCDACRNVGNLDLKIVAHHGRFLRQTTEARRPGSTSSSRTGCSRTASDGGPTSCSPKRRFAGPVSTPT